MRRYILHNQILPTWMHRAINGLVGALLALAILSLLGGALWSLWLGVPIGIGCMLRNQLRFSFVEGIAGEAGYDELDDGKGE